MKIGIIGGTGFYEPGIFNEEKETTVSTPYGQVSLRTGDYKGRGVVFLARHGARHTTPPHLVNYRANIWALREIGVEKVIATAAVGSLRMDMKPGEIVLRIPSESFGDVRIRSEVVWCRPCGEGWYLSGARFVEVLGVA